MAISRAQLAAELEPGLNSHFGMEYDKYEQEYSEIFSNEDSQKAFEEEIKIAERRAKLLAMEMDQAKIAGNISADLLDKQKESQILF